MIYGEQFQGKAIADVMVKNPSTINCRAMAVKILEILREKNINAIPVVDDGGYIKGVIDIQDLPKFKVL